MDLKWFLIVTLLAGNASRTLAQIKVRYEEGTITTRDGTMIRGYIKGISSDNVNGDIYYRRNESDATSERLSAEQTERIVFDNGEVYENKEFKVDATTAGRSLAKLLTSGPLMLYECRYSNATCFIIEKGDRQFLLRRDRLEGASLRHFFYNNLLVVATDDAPEMHDRAQRTDFNENKIKRFVTDYNRSKGVQAEELIRTPSQKANFFLVFAEVGITKSPEFFGQAIYRYYNAKFSHSTSLNVGFDYYAYVQTQNVVPFIIPYNGADPVYSERVKGQIYSIPVFVQQNFLNRKFRPFVVVGCGFGLLNEIHQYEILRQQKGYGYSYGFSLVAGLGVEWNVTSHMLLRTEYRYDVGGHPVFVGIGYLVGK